MIDTIGIDISKAMLDAYWQSGKKHKQFCNTGSGSRALVRWIERSDAALVVFEATTARQGMRSMPERGVFTIGFWKLV